MARRSIFFGVAVTLTAALTAGCGGGAGGGTGGPIEAPVVRSFSPWAAAIDMVTNRQAATFTNSRLSTATDLRFRGKVVAFMQGQTDIDPASVFVGGDPVLGPDPSSIVFQREVPGVGNVAVPIQVTLADATGSGTRNALVCQPLPPFAIDLGDFNGDGQSEYQTALPDGQYTIGVFRGLTSSNGKALRDGPVFHTFTVGDSDTIAPRVVSSDPANGQRNVGAGSAPAAPPPGVPEDSIAAVTTNIFGDTTPDVVIRFSEPVDAASVTLTTVQAVDAGAFVPGGGAPPPLIPAAGYPRLRSVDDGTTLPSNGHEVILRIDPGTGGFPFGTQVKVRILGAWRDAASMAANPATADNPFPIRDLAGNAMPLDATIMFQTIAPPDLPENPFPEYAIWWSASNRVGAIDTINQRALGDQVLGTQFPFGVPKNVVPEFTDMVATSANIKNFDPFEINFDGRTNMATCHAWIYVQSQGTGQVAILHTRDGIPVALIDSPSPGGIAVQVGAGSDDVLLVTNSGANTFTAYDIGLQTPGTRSLNAPFFIKKVQPTGNTPRAISATSWGGAAPVEAWNRDGVNAGPSVPVIMYADFSDGTVNTIRMADTAPVRQFALGPSSAPNDVCLTPCFTMGAPIMFAAISQGGTPGNGKVAYYVAGPGCQTGSQTNARPDAIVGDIGGLDGPAGLDENFQSGTPVFFSVAESGSQANAVSTLGVQTGAANLPRLINRFTNVGANPTRIAHRASWFNPCIAPAGSGGCAAPGARTCWFGGTEQAVLDPPLTRRDFSMVPTKDIYVCARGSSQITVIDLTSGARSFYSPIQIPGVRFVAGQATQ